MSNVSVKSANCPLFQYVLKVAIFHPVASKISAVFKYVV